jgi:hypothetical protein
MTLEPVIVELDLSKEGRVSVEITEDMTPQVFEAEKGDLIRFRDNILTVPRDGMYEVHAHGVTELGRC